MIEKPMNPYAAEDFRNAVNSIRKVSEDFKRIGEQMKANIEEGMMSFIELDEMPEEYSGVMRLKCDEDATKTINALLYNGYEVTMRFEDATEVEREVDGVDKFMVIEYGEVE